jgi:hypothetical protein
MGMSTYSSVKALMGYRPQGVDLIDEINQLKERISILEKGSSHALSTRGLKNIRNKKTEQADDADEDIFQGGFGSF